MTARLHVILPSPHIQSQDEAPAVAWIDLLIDHRSQELRLSHIYTRRSNCHVRSSLPQGFRPRTSSSHVSSPLRGRLDGDVRLPSTLVRLRRNNHVIMVTKGHPRRRPRVKEGPRVDGPAGPQVPADGPVLLEGGGTVDGRLVGAGALVEVVRAVIGLDGAAGLTSTTGVVLAHVLDDVVLDKGVAGPAVDGEVLSVLVVLLSECLVEVRGLTALPLFTGSQDPE